MPQDPETPGESTDSTLRIPPGSMSPEDRDDTTSGGGAGSDEKVSDLPEDATEDEKADKESKDSFPASDPPAW